MAWTGQAGLPLRCEYCGGELGVGRNEWEGHLFCCLACRLSFQNPQLPGLDWDEYVKRTT